MHDKTGKDSLESSIRNKIIQKGHESWKYKLTAK